ncbi:DUF1800 family protein [Candidatus Uabimicrobium amorphum]|uniref:Carbohydrate binding module xylan-binding domain-containing protein n=1 Tax=Uabimicrobium amorphum TaxID=2596890 RepID=A0A5S9F6U0_UABAM|nr:DUF1800 family protein [Candidatus Uabimicrobium amorphum]BBM88236.1 hypothetical protein UABAM_06657 [Candidatus Uabimicrobium amorphum]
MKFVLIFLLFTVVYSDDFAFVCTKTVVAENETRMIAIRSKKKAVQNQPLVVSSTNPECVMVIEQPTFLKEYDLAYVRIRGQKVGTTKLTLANNHQLEITCTAKNSNVQLNIITPITGSSVCGKFTVAVDVSAYDESQKASVSLHTNSHVFTANKILRLDAYHSRYLFNVDSSLLPETCDLFARCNDVVSERVAVSVAKHVVKRGECEDDYVTSAQQRFGRGGKFKVASHPEAGGEKYIFCASVYPAWSFEYNCPSPGRYQLLLRAKGDLAGGEFPAVNIYANDQQALLTGGQIVDSNWHRVAIGKPFALDKGKNVITVFFANDFFATPWADRNLMLDQYELVSVDNTANSSMMMMQKPTNRHQVKIALDSVFDGEVVTGCTFLQGNCITSSQIAPIVKLHINDKVFCEQQGYDIFFPVFRESLRQGENSVYLSAQIEGGVTYTGEKQTLINPQKLSSPTPKFYRFPSASPYWSDEKKMVKTQGKNHPVLFFATNKTYTLKLPENIRGNFRVYVEAKGQDFRGRAKLQVSVDDKKLPVVEIPRYWGMRELGHVQIIKGNLQLSFVNDAFEEGIGDRNLFVNAIMLVEIMPPDETPPNVRIVHPQQDEVVHSSDVVVAEICDNDLVGVTNIYVNGQSKNMSLQRLGRAGHYVFPLPLTNLKPGKHRVFVRATDVVGNVAESKEVTFIVAEEKPVSGTKYSRAVALLNRFAHGPEFSQLAKLLAVGEKNWLTQQLDVCEDVRDRIVYTRVMKQFPIGSLYAIQQRALLQLLLTSNPVHARFVMWAQNHFSTWIRKTQAAEKWKEHQRFYQHGVGRFYDLLLLSATSPAMLFYLDQDGSFANRINENYAREIMELHTLGVNGGYTQQDVTALARLLTGWTCAAIIRSKFGGINREQRFAAILNSGKEEVILGVRFPVASGCDKAPRVLRALELLAAHPSTARFVCQKFAKHYVSSPVPEELVDDLVEVFHESYGDFNKILLTLSEHPLFWKDALRCKKFANPQDYAMRMARSVELKFPGFLTRYLANSGMSLFDCATPDGYSEDPQSYTDSNMILQRWRLSSDLVNQLFQLVPGPWRRAYAVSNREFLQEAIDIIAMRITGDVLGEKSRKLAEKIIDKPHENHRKKLRELIIFITKLPEMNFK